MSNEWGGEYGLRQRLNALVPGLEDGIDMCDAYRLIIARIESTTVLVEALEWIAGLTDKPYCTYYERTLDDGTVVPITDEVAQDALKAYNGTPERDNA